MSALVRQSQTALVCSELPLPALGVELSRGDALVFQGPPKPFDEDVIKEAAFAVH